MRTFLMPMEVETDIEKIKYSTINNVFHLVKRQDLRARLYPISYQQRKQCHCFVIVPLYRYFFAA